MGMGLNLCRSIIESHQGRMQAQNIYNSQEVVGCSFSFWLPLDIPESTATNSRSTSHPNNTAGTTGLVHEFDPEKGTVYVVDDDEAVRDSLQWLLEGKDYRVRCFDSAENFLARYDPRNCLPHRRYPHGRHERPGATRPPDRAQVPCPSFSLPATATCPWS